MGFLLCEGKDKGKLIVYNVSKFDILKLFKHSKKMRKIVISSGIESDFRSHLL